MLSKRNSRLAQRERTRRGASKRKMVMILVQLMSVKLNTLSGTKVFPKKTRNKNLIKPTSLTVSIAQTRMKCFFIASNGPTLS